MKNIIILISLLIIENYTIELFSQSDTLTDAGKNRIGVSMSLIYPDRINRFGAGVETNYIHELKKNFFYGFSLGYGMAYHEVLGGEQFSYAVTLSNLEHYAHYMLTTSIGYNYIHSQRHRAGLSVGFAGRYFTYMHVNYPYHSLLPDDYPFDYFEPEMIEGYSFSVLTGISYSYLITDNIGIQAEVKCIFMEFTNIAIVNAGIFYKF